MMGKMGFKSRKTVPFIGWMMVSPFHLKLPPCSVLPSPPHYQVHHHQENMAKGKMFLRLKGKWVESEVLALYQHRPEKKEQYINNK